MFMLRTFYSMMLPERLQFQVSRSTGSINSKVFGTLAVIIIVVIVVVIVIVIVLVIVLVIVIVIVIVIIPIKIIT